MIGGDAVVLLFVVGCHPSVEEGDRHLTATRIREDSVLPVRSQSPFRQVAVPADLSYGAAYDSVLVNGGWDLPVSTGRSAGGTFNMVGGAVWRWMAGWGMGRPPE